MKARAMILDRPLTFLFGAGVHLRNQLYDSGTLKSRELAGPVISVGSLSVGGAGKTPFTIMLGELLKARGIAFDILSRGYRRSTTGTAIVDPNGSARQFGDEPLLMARRLEVPVIVGEERYQAGLLAERTHGTRLHLLDDGFQHRRLKRQFDIALVTPEDVNDHLLPGGRLREPLSGLLRADAVVAIGEVDSRELPSDVKTVFRVHRALAIPDRPARPVIFCGIARPQRFLDELHVRGIEPVALEIYRDHHAYSDANVKHLLRMRDRRKADGFITTEKDAINLGALLDQLGTVSIARVEMTLDDADGFIDLMRSTLQQRGKPVP